MWVSGRHSCFESVLSDDGANSGQGQRFSSVRAFRDEEESCARRVRPLGDQIRLDQAGEFDVERDSAFLGAFAYHANLAKNVRHRFNRGGDTHANNALLRIAMIRSNSDERTHVYTDLGRGNIGVVCERLNIGGTKGPITKEVVELSSE